MITFEEFILKEPKYGCHKKFKRFYNKLKEHEGEVQYFKTQKIPNQCGITKFTFLNWIWIIQQHNKVLLRRFVGRTGSTQVLVLKEGSEFLKVL